ncbi:hypothetical protein KIPB_011797, partial [Kipferlia bialata]
LQKPAPAPFTPPSPSAPPPSMSPSMRSPSSAQMSPMVMSRTGSRTAFGRSPSFIGSASFTGSNNGMSETQISCLNAYSEASQAGYLTDKGVNHGMIPRVSELMQLAMAEEDETVTQALRKVQRGIVTGTSRPCVIGSGASAASVFQPIPRSAALVDTLTQSPRSM